MKKWQWPALAAATGLLATGLTTTEAVAADPAPTNVQIGWKDETLKFIHVTWDEEGVQPNKIVVRLPGTAGSGGRYVTADAPNEVDIAAAGLTTGHSSLEIAVAVGTEAGVTSPFAASAHFDTLGAGVPSLVSFTMAGTSTVTVKWKSLSLDTDGTPGDPLDGPDIQRYSTWYSLPPSDTKVVLSPPSTATEATFTGPGPNFTFGATSSNAWATRSLSLVEASPRIFTARIPSLVTAGTVQSDVTGTFNGDTAQVVLQARNTSMSPWYTVAAQTFYQGTYRYELGLAGSRHYRVLIPNTPTWDGKAYFGGYSQVGAMTVQMNGWSSLTENSGRRGQTVRTHLQVRPKIDVKVRLERWNGKAWTTVGPVQVAAGNGYAYLKGVAPGRVAYRYYIPSGWIKGMWYAAKYTPNFFVTTV